MIKRILLFVLCLGVALGHAQTVTLTLSIDGSLNPTQITDTIGYGMVLPYLAAPTDVTTAQKVARIGLNSTDTTILTQALPNFLSNYDAAATTSQAAMDGVVSSTITNLQNTLSAAGVVALEDFVRVQKTGIKLYADSAGTSITVRTFYTLTPIEIGNPTAGFSGYFGDVGGQEVIPPHYTCTFQPRPPVYTVTNGTGTTFTGTVSGYFGYVTYPQVLQATQPPTDNGEVGAGEVFSGTIDYTVFVTGSICSTQTVSTRYSVEIELAYTKVMRTGPGQDCTRVNGQTVCAFPVNQDCVVVHPDYAGPDEVEDTQWPAWHTLGLCGQERDTATGLAGKSAWMCIPAPIIIGTTFWNAIGTSDISQSAHCTYNPNW